jgi:Ca2+-transporting ATPase
MNIKTEISPLQLQIRNFVKGMAVIGSLFFWQYAFSALLKRKIL